MRSFVSAAAVGLAASSLVSAVPFNAGSMFSPSSIASGSAQSTGAPKTDGQMSGYGEGSGHGSGHSSGHGNDSGHGSGNGGKDNGVGVEIVGDGFPFPNAQQLLKIEKGAKGTLSNAPPPPSLTADTATSLRFVAFNENFESVFFQDLLNNVTNNVDGYTFENNAVKGFIENAIKVIVKQEELHSINAENALVKVVKTDPIQPCRYQFPVSDFASAINLAARFTDVVLGTLPDIMFHAGVDGDDGLIPGVAAALGNEGEQEGFFRILQGLRPSELPFLTRSTRNFAFSALQDFVIPGSCPNENEIDLTIFQPLTANDPPAKTTDLDFKFSLKPQRFVPKGSKTVDISDFKEKYGGNKWEGELFITYLNQQNVPASRPLKSLTIDLETEDVTVVAEFPFDDVVNGTPLEMFGLTIATLTVGDNLADAAAMDAATLFGPALLETIEPPVGKMY